MIETNLPVLLLKELILLPFNEIRIEISKGEDKKVLNISEQNHENYILCVNVPDFVEEKPSIRHLPKIAILAKIKSKIELPNGLVRLVLIGIDRVEVLNYVEDNDNNLYSYVVSTKEYDFDEMEATALKRILLKDLNEYIEISPYISNNVLGRINGINNIGRLSDIIAFELPIDYHDKLKYIEMTNPMNRLKLTIEDLHKEIETVKIEDEIETTLKSKIDIEQRNYILREKIRLIKEELEEDNLKENDIKEIKQKLLSLQAPEKIKERIQKEIEKYEMLSDNSPEVGIIRNYIECLMSLPWEISTEDNKDISKIKNVLDNSHYGLNEIKERIIEYIATKDICDKDQSIICFVGPPGVGKTTMAKSIANALNKNFVKISVGGLDDVSEIIGHRKTYIGSYPGKIIQGLKKVKSNNPVFLIDEIDKMNSNNKSNPIASLLDILDKEQNNRFVDNYIEEEFDLSKVMFILTANDLSSIPTEIKDRLEIIELNSYTIEEKESIAEEYIIPSLNKEYNLNLTFSDKVIKEIIIYYTKEAGIRELNRCITNIYRKHITYSYDGNEIEDIKKYLGNYKYKYLYNNKCAKPGIVNTLAYTPYGGLVLKTTSVYYKGNGNIEITGQIGNVMKESTTIALSYIKENSEIFNIDYSLFTNNFHIHFEEGSIPKDGPSAGVSIVTSLISTLKKMTIPNTVSMTGEITLRGKILPVGGLKEKLITATISNIKTVYVPLDNKEEVMEIDKSITSKLKIKYVDDYIEIYNDLFQEK
ncbi:MAG: endopeptidase La [Bacilli bacterium]|jgi:ATP-dependent Lon protease|nr:endopeptidase La [Clostridium sp.]MDY3797972.1 endopeptidase La [Bacilli bacterium]CDE95978.1 lon protease [Clostridium sp. CAG:914]